MLFWVTLVYSYMLWPITSVVKKTVVDDPARFGLGRDYSPQEGVNA